MANLTRRQILSTLAFTALATRPSFSVDLSGWIPLFDGKSLHGWKAEEHAGAFRVENGCIVSQGGRAHLYYTGPVQQADFKNFQLHAEVMTTPGTTSGIYFHTAPQPAEWPTKGLKVQINNTREAAGTEEHRKTGSLFAVRNIYKPLAKDNEWVNLDIEVKGKSVSIAVNGISVVKYFEPQEPFLVDPNKKRMLGHGTFALQSHAPSCRTLFRNIRVYPLPDEAYAGGSDLSLHGNVDDTDREILRLGAANYPLVDYHVHLKGGLDTEAALAISNRTGIHYGLAINCGLGFPVHSDSSVMEYLATMVNKSCYVALQGEGREWMTFASRESLARFDYIFTDAMTFTDDNGKRMRIWISEEIGTITDKQAFMEMYVKRILGVLREPIDIYANAAFLPQQIAAEFDTLWTPERRNKVIEAAVKNDVAIEINNRYKIPHAGFIRAAKAAGAKFSFGTNNNDEHIGRMEYAIEMVKECDLKPEDIFIPKADGKKAIQVKN